VGSAWDAWRVSERLHDDEPDTSESVVRALLRAELPHWAESQVECLATSGTDNAMWRLRTSEGPDVVVRLPRRPAAAANVLGETSVLHQVHAAEIGSVVRTPRVRHVGQPHERFAHHWSVLEWLDGADAWTARTALGRRELNALATELATAVAAIGGADITGVSERVPGSRGGPLGPLLERLDSWLTLPAWNATDLIDVAAVRRLASEAHEIVDEPIAQGFVHGDLIPGNLLVDRGHLTSIIDWGGAGRGDLAQDLAPAWAVLTEVERPAFKEAVGCSEAAWIRGRTFELEHAVGGVLYYVPKKHPLGDVMARTLQRILASPRA
jgi:aminoglycoside phosphotransferase (APT) family kinase protein